jgi:hypothetical protein
VLAGAAVACACAHALPARADDAACIAASERAITLRKQGALKETLQQLALCADEACPGEVKAECTRRIEDVRAAQPTLILSAKDGAGNDLLAVQVTMDGAPLLASLDGRPLAIDPGAHAFRFEAVGQKPVEKTLVLREGEKDRRESIVVGEPPPAPPLPLGPPPASSWSPQRTIALVTGGVGVAGLGVGALFGAFAISAKNREQGDCPSAGCSGYAQAKADYDTANKDATGSTIAFIAGGVFVSVGAVLWLTAPATGPTPDATRGAIDRASAVRVGLAPSTRGQGLSLVGTW